MYKKREVAGDISTLAEATSPRPLFYWFRLLLGCGLYLRFLKNSRSFFWQTNSKPTSRRDLTSSGVLHACRQVKSTWNQKRSL